MAWFPWYCYVRVLGEETRAEDKNANFTHDDMFLLHNQNVS